MIEIIPATDIIDGRCVRSDTGRLRPEENLLRRSARSGAAIRGGRHPTAPHGRSGRGEGLEPRNLRTLERIAARTSLEVQYGGGIKSREALETVFNAGASRAICGSIAVRQPELSRHGSRNSEPEGSFSGPTSARARWPFRAGPRRPG